MRLYQTRKWTLSYLIPSDFTNSKIRGFRMCKVQAGHGSSRFHSQRFRQADSGARFRLQQSPHGQLLRVVRLARISRSWTDPLRPFTTRDFIQNFMFQWIDSSTYGVFNFEQLGRIQMFLGGVAPHIRTDRFVKRFRKSFRQAIGQSFDHDDVVVVVILLVTSD